MFSKVIAISALAASASAHMIMTNPKPFGQATLNNSPLGPADFPCKQRAGVYAVSEMNQWNAGETQVITFQGTAVHGGGSCQFSITTDPEPTEKSQWKVIQSVTGGCPSDAPGNLDGPDAGKLPGTFPVTMPSNIPDGRYTFAWTWINKVGQREFYMNCAPIQVGSGSGTASTKSAAQALSALPDMYVANLPNTVCATTEGQDFVYPDPGQNVVKANLKANLGNTLTGAGCATQNKMGAGAGQIGSPSAGTPSSPSSPSTPSEGYPSKPSNKPSPPKASEKPAASSGTAPNKGPAESKIPSNPGGVFAPGASSAPAAAPTAQPDTPAAQPTTLVAKPTPSATPEPPNTPDNNTTPANGECTPCTNDGAVVCIGSKQFGLCNRGCAVAQDLAAGMACSNGVVVASTKRHVHFPRSHLHRRLSAAHLL
jgi:hypothetical protein